MEPVSSLFGLAVVCYQLGTVLLETYNTWKDAHEEVHERVVIVEGVWIRSKRQMEFMERVAHKIDDDLFHALDNLLQQLHRRLNIAASKIESIKQKDSSQRGGFMSRSRSRTKMAWVLKKDALDETIKDLEEWQRRFDPSWFFIIAIGDPIIDSELHRGRKASFEKERRGPPDVAKNPLAVAAGIRAALGAEGQQRSMFLPEEKMEMMDIRYSEAKLGRLLSTSGDNKWYVTNTILSRPGIASSVLAEDTGNLATKLSKSDPLAFGLLNCKGVMPVTIKQPHSPGSRSRDRLDSVRMIFRIPDGMDTLQSLRDAMLMFPLGVSQTRRLRIACELAKSISYMHTFKFVHKNIRPESILCFEQGQQSNTFLVGFDAFRAADGSTNLLGDQEWDRNIYRHPQRQGVYIAEQYRMEHDMYSLGVCLLEIGLWESLVDYTSVGPVVQAVPGKWYAGMETWLYGHSPQSHERPWKVKEYFTELTKNSLPVRMGDKYTAAVMACITCLDDLDDREGGDGGAEVAVRFIEEILFLLDEIAT